MLVHRFDIDVGPFGERIEGLQIDLIPLRISAKRAALCHVSVGKHIRCTEGNCTRQRKFRVQFVVIESDGTVIRSERLAVLELAM